MDYDQAVKNGDIFFGWLAWMEQDGYAPGESIAFDFENGSGTYTYQGKIAGSFVSAETFIRVMSGYGSGQRRHEGMPPYDAQFRRT